MSTFSSDAEETKYRAFMEQFYSVRDSIVRTRDEINTLTLDISLKQGQLHTRRSILLRYELKLRELTRIKEGET